MAIRFYFFLNFRKQHSLHYFWKLTTNMLTLAYHILMQFFIIVKHVFIRISKPNGNLIIYLQKMISMFVYRMLITQNKSIFESIKTSSMNKSPFYSAGIIPSGVLMHSHMEWRLMAVKLPINRNIMTNKWKPI